MKFRNQEDELHFQQEGYAIVPLLSKADCRILLELFEDTQDSNREGIRSALHGKNRKQNQQISDRIFVVAWPAIETVMENVASYAATFLAKYTGESGLLDYHQDVGLVDEGIDSSINIWIPLVDVDEQNGAVSVLRKSHQLFPSVRANTFSSHYLPFVDELKPFAKTLKMKAGDALFYDHRLFHGSLPNRSSTTRVAVVMGATKKNAQLVYYYCNGELQHEGKLEAYAMSPAEFQDMVFDHAGFVTNSLRPTHLKPYSKSMFTTAVYTMEDVLAKLRGAHQ